MTRPRSDEPSGRDHAPAHLLQRDPAHLKDKAPDCPTGVVDGLRQTLRYIAGTCHQHPNYEAVFVVQDPATTETWIRP